MSRSGSKLPVALALRSASQIRCEQSIWTPASQGERASNPLAIAAMASPLFHADLSSAEMGKGRNYYGVGPSIRRGGMNPKLSVDLSGADFSFANLTDANLNGSDLTGASFLDADLSGANLREANLAEAIYQPRKHPVLDEVNLAHGLALRALRETCLWSYQRLSAAA